MVRGSAVKWAAKRAVMVSFIGASLAGCSNVPEQRGQEEQAAYLASPPREIVDAIELVLRKKLTLHSDAEIQRYLTSLSTRLLPPNKSTPEVFLVSGANANYEPSVWTVPGGKIFFDIRILKNLKFENEIAAALALAWDRAEGTQFRERLISESSRGNPDPMKIWTFSQEENQLAIEAAVGRVYKAGYDPRGLVSYFDRVPTKSKNLAEAEKDALKDRTRRAITNYAPLLNPIVRTEYFYKMRKKLERL